MGRTVGGLQDRRAPVARRRRPSGRRASIARFGLVLAVVAALPLGGTAARAAGPGAFEHAGVMTEPRIGHTGTLLADGRVLLAGGAPAPDAAARYLSTTETWDPATATFTTSGGLTEGRGGHTATLLEDGRVLLVGGGTGVLGDGRVTASAEAWDPASGSTSATGTLAEARTLHTATRLDDGRVLIVGGFADGGTMRSTAELWDPATASFTPAGSLGTGRYGHTATLLPDGRVLIAGGVAGGDGAFRLLATTETWDPATGTFSPGREMLEAHANHTAVGLSDGTVLVVGGLRTQTEPAAAERTDLFSGAWTATGAPLRPRVLHTASLLPDGRVLLIGGTDGSSPLILSELWDPATDAFAEAASLPAPRAFHAATTLADSRVLVTGSIRESDVWAP